jgi:single-strand DNA-binding protein
MSDVLVGNLTAEPELRFTPNGNAVANLRVAVNTRVKQGDQWVDGETSYHDVTVWRAQAEHAADALQKGDRIVAAGYWKDREWTTREGEPRKSKEFIADDLGISLKFKTLSDLVQGR